MASLPEARMSPDVMDIAASPRTYLPLGTTTVTMVGSVTTVHMRGIMCACLEHSARCPDPGRCWQLSTTWLIEINGSLGVVTGRSADSFKHQMLHGIRLAFQRLLLCAGESPARGYMGCAAGPAGSDLGYCRHPRAAGSR